jgi:hypothetical protein
MPPFGTTVGSSSAARKVRRHRLSHALSCSSELEVYAGGLDAEREERDAAAIRCGGFLVGHAAAARVEERFSWEEECCGEGRLQ